VTLGSFVGVLGMLGLVLGLLLLTLKLVRRFVPLVGSAGGHVELEVVQRVALGPRQGIAVVRIGDQQVAVSVGEGGVHFIAHVAPPDDDVTPATPLGADDGLAPASGAGRTMFHRLLGAAIRLPVVLGLLFAAGTAVAQTPPRPAIVAKPSAPAAAPSVARVDTMLTRLAPRLDLRVGNEQAGGLRLSGTVGIVVMMGLLTLLPMLVLMMTGFTRILIVLHFLRQAIGAQSAPPAQLVAGLALLLTGFVMAPTLREVNRTALEPWMDGRIEQAQMLAVGVQPFRAFMLRQTRTQDLATFMKLSRLAPVARVDDVPLIVLISAFVTSELRVAFQMGFALFLPFIVIDVVVASVLMSMGMMMLPPAMISLPFKLLLFVLVDGWALLTQSLVQSFR
jgi:flagellar biosynthetic protein FliP